MDYSKEISVVGRGEVSPLSDQPNAYRSEQHFLNRIDEKDDVYAGFISDLEHENLELLRNSNKKYKALDRSVLMAIMASKKAVEDARWYDVDFGINLGSSRGATALTEKHFLEFLKEGKVSSLASPTTTLGNLSTWVAHALNQKGINLSHSNTCSTALHSLLNGIAWINSGMQERFLVGGAEAPITPFTISQMNALKIYGKGEFEYPCRSVDLSKKSNSMVLGEAASCIAIERGLSKQSKAWIRSWGYAQEQIEHHTSISLKENGFLSSMQMAIETIDPAEIDVIVMHAPGTIVGDQAEYNSIVQLFGEKIPPITSNKWKIGHTLGASGMTSLNMALEMIENQEFYRIPFLEENGTPKQIKNILINAAGFGGNAVSIVVSKNPLN